MFKHRDVVGIGIHAIEQVVRLKELNGSAHALICPPWNYELIEGGFMGNILIALAHLGLSAGYLGMVGGDRFGIKLMKSRSAEVVDFSHCEIIPSSESAKTWLILDPQGEHRRILFPNILAQVNEEYIMRQASYIKSCRLLLIDVSVIPLSACVLAAELAKSEQIPVLVCLNVPTGELFTTLKNGAPTELEELISFSDLFLASPGDLQNLAPMDDAFEQIEHLQKKYIIPNIVLWEGRQGCVIASNEEITHSPAFEVETPNLLGCRDAFMAGMAFGFFQDWSLPMAARFANACAALNSLSTGVYHGMKSEEEIMEFLSKHS